ncbi:carboxypeptidase-like regulatory domain-containing protein [Clavibacter sepedonicus]|uniref:Surface-anchored protein n=1 Tax=Clavibacter sepedonicus TaxID=31964 RepID=B0RC97_CLASE|nr:MULTISPECIES: carboxypeptidase-like regulatory domain-containing protein [Clavibacter]MBD5381081.1 carboxypeptidase regulatory-like domain-containing protein [Clavibacter sp.]OQJ48494.1 TonB-dependent receptor [Clavibacter sepedonicus]OQJ53975.1 TonB-dependent receptor [Clavibacter sepedonicus]UUK65504.1 carboxypeptidase-like regulatory domain-containing protein [Clavibacter sepedonicus]CAQ02984.1 putative surface-anchored protein [Clavibacter sepedonicus]
MPSVRRRGLVGLISLALIAAAQAGPASPASADPAPSARVAADATTAIVVGRVYLDRVDPRNLVRDGSISLELSGIPFGENVDIVDGSFRFESQPATRYTLHAFLTVGGAEVSQYLGQVNEWQDARFFTAPAGRTTRVDVVLRTPASIGGTVMLPEGAPAGYSPVDVLRATGDGRLEASGTTDEAGRYTIENLEPGFYVLRFGVPPGDPTSYGAVWSGDRTQRAQAKRIVVSQWGQVVTGVDATLAPAR